MIRVTLGTAAVDAAAKAATAIPVVGAPAAAMMKLLDSVLPQEPFCDPRSMQLLNQMAMRRQMYSRMSTSSGMQRALMDADRQTVKLIQQYELACRRNPTVFSDTTRKTSFLNTTAGTYTVLGVGAAAAIVGLVLLFR